jgi:hypothetical protein
MQAQDLLPLPINEKVPCDMDWIGPPSHSYVEALMENIVMVFSERAFER